MTLIVLSLISAVEICGNPRDLVLWVWKDSQNKKYGIGISRGEGHNYKFMITSNEGHLDDVVVGIQMIRAYLEMAIDIAGEGTATDGCLTSKMVDDIVVALAAPPHNVNTAILFPNDDRVLH